MYGRSLPPLDLLLPFEAAARLQSFTRAAEELNVTQSAISQRVRTLESALGVALFERRHRRIELTPEGRDLLNSVSVALQHLLSATQGVRRSVARRPVRLAVDSAIAAFWLVPRLGDALAADPELDVDLTVSDDVAAILVADVAILHGEGNWPGFSARLLFADAVFPVCAPRLCARYDFAAPDLFARVPLLELDYVRWNWMNWSIWLTHAGHEAGGAVLRLKSNSYATVIEAARSGIGLALGWEHLVGPDLRSGVLVRPLPQVVSSGFGYYLARREGAPAAARRLADALAVQGEAGT